MSDSETGKPNSSTMPAWWRQAVLTTPQQCQRRKSAAVTWHASHERIASAQLWSGSICNSQVKPSKENAPKQIEATQTYAQDNVIRGQVNQLQRGDSDGKVPPRHKTTLAHSAGFASDGDA